MNEQRKSVRLHLTDEQKQAIRQAIGKDADVLEMSVEELEERIAPVTLSPIPVTRHIDVSSPNLF